MTFAHVERPARPRAPAGRPGRPRPAARARRRPRRGPSTSPGSAASPCARASAPTLRPIGVRTVSTWWPMNRITRQDESRRDGSRGGPGSRPTPRPASSVGRVRDELEGDLGAGVARRRRRGHRRPAAGTGSGSRSSAAARSADRAPARTPGPAGVRWAPDGDDHVVGLEPARRRRSTTKRSPCLREPVDAHAGPHGKLEAGRVGLEVVGHLVLRGERPAGRREAPARQAVVAGRGEQAQRVPALRQESPIRSFASRITNGRPRFVRW